MNYILRQKVILKAIFLAIAIVGCFNLFPKFALAATYYWYGGAGNWSDYTNHWSNNSGNSPASPAEAMPGAGDSVIFDSNSGAGTSAVDAGFGGAITNLTTSAGYTGTISLSINLAVSGTFTLGAGTYSANAKTTTVTGLVSINAGTYQASTAAQTFNGGLTIAGGTFTGSSGLVSATNVTLSSGTLTAPSGAFNVSGDWSISGGTFTAGSRNTVTFNGSGAQTITSGGKSFNSIVIINASASGVSFADRLQTAYLYVPPDGAVLKFSAASAVAPHTISTLLDISGGTSKITLGPSVAATTWYLSPPANTSLNAVIVSYSNSDKAITATNSTDGTNNVNWTFPSGALPTYFTVGSFISTDFLPSSGSSMINYFTYTATIPAGTSIGFQFSVDGAYWYSASGSSGALTSLSDGTNTIDLSALGWKGPGFYYRTVLKSNDGSNTPSLDSVTLGYLDFDGTYYTYNTSGNFTSTNLFSGIGGVFSIDSFAYNMISLPPGASGTVQFSQDNTNWFNSAGTPGGTNAFSVGTNTINLAGLVWSGV